MNPLLTPRTTRRFVLSALVASFVLAFTLSLSAQEPELSLADLLIGLRSKKATLADRNAILTEAVKQRGITFMLKAEIEKELVATGAATTLLDAIRSKSQVAVVAQPTPVPVATPVPTPTPPDFSFYQRRADASLVNGDYTLAVTDYDKAVELKADDAVAFLNRGKAHYNLKAFDKASADYDKAIELDPKDSKAYYNRGMLFERLGNLDKAIADYQKAVDLDASNQAASAGLKKLKDDQMAKAALLAPPPVVAAPVVTEPIKAPEKLNLGNITDANATSMVTPIYPPIARKANIQGKVTVEVELDEKGEVVSAKAVNGHKLLRDSAEDAAKRSRFKPAMFDSQPIKSFGTITYNFSLKQSD